MDINLNIDYVTSAQNFLVGSCMKMEDMKANTASEDYHIVDTTSLMYVQVYGFLIYDLKIHQ